jgi:[calcium/calmodulin-dependent protein kinase] kinase
MISTSGSIQTVVPRAHSHSRSVIDTPTGIISGDGTVTPGLFTDHEGNIIGTHLWRGREYLNDLEESPSRAKSVDRGVFNSENKRAEASVAMSNAVAPGKFELSTPLRHPRPSSLSRSTETSPTNMNHDRQLPSPHFFQPYMVQQHQISQSSSTPNVPHSAYAASNLDERPATANRTPEGKTPAPRVYGISTPESFARAQKELDRKKQIEAEADKLKELSGSHMMQPSGPIDCPPSPDDHIFQRKQEEESRRAQSSSSVNSNDVRSQLTSPSDLVSSISSDNLGSEEQLFPSVPSLPALISSGSSVCADPEGDFLQHPGVVSPPQAVLSSSDTPDTLTPPILSKEPSLEGTTSTGTISLDAEDDGYNADGDTTVTVEEESDSSDSDEGLTMTRRRPTVSVPAPRRGTNASVGSTETAKKMVMDN